MGLSKVIVSTIGLYSCRFRKICWAKADYGSLFWICKETLCCEDSSLLRYYTMLTGKQLLTFWRGAVPSSSGSSTLALLELLDPEEGGTTILWNVSNCLPEICFTFECLTLKKEFQQVLASDDSFCILLKTRIYSQFSFTETPFIVSCTWTC